MRAFRSDTLTNLHEQLCHKIVHASAEELDVISNVDVQIHNTISEASSMEWDFDLKNLWLTPSRWTMMINQYIDPVELQAWIEKVTTKIGTSGRGIAVMRTKSVAARGGPHQGNKETRRWGSCMLAISYKAMPKPQITLYSRTSYLGYLSALDLSVAWMCGRYLAQEMGKNVEDFSFVWMNEALQYHNFKSMAYLLNHPDATQRALYRGYLMDRVAPDIDGSSPALKMTRNWLQKVIAEDDAGKTLGDMTYNTYRRIRRRFHTEVMGIEYAKQFEGWSYHKKGPHKGEKKEFFKAYQELPHCLVKDLDFSKLKMPLGGTYGGEFDGSSIEEEDDE